MQIIRIIAPVMLFIAILLPFFLLGHPDLIIGDLQEKRIKSSFPVLPPSVEEYISYTKKFDQFMFDNFGMRSIFITANAYMKYKVFNTPLNDKVIIGKQGWMYLNNKHNIRDYLGIKQVSQKELRDWRILFEEFQTWLETRGASFLLIVVPSKQIIYPEFMPDYLGNRTINSKIDRFMEYMQDHSKVRILDLRPSLQKAKTSRLVYFKTDSHWNFQGGLVAYRAIADLLPDFINQDRIYKDNDISFKQDNFHTNLSQIIGLSNVETIYKPRPKNGWRANKVKPAKGNQELKKYENDISISQINDPSLRKAVMFVDSFGRWNSEYLAEHFRRMVVVNLWGSYLIYRNGFPLELIENEKPDLVLLQLVDGHLDTCKAPSCITKKHIDTNPPVIRQARLRKLFFDNLQQSINYKFVKQRNIAMPEFKNSSNKKITQLIFEPDRDGIEYSGPLIIRLNIESDGTGEIQSAFNKSDICIKNREVFNIKIENGHNELFLCSERLNHEKELILNYIAEKPDINLVSVTTVPHPDVPQ